LHAHVRNLSRAEKILRVELGRTALEATALTLGEASPDSKALIMRKGIFKTFLSNIAREADALSFTCGATLFREEGLRVSLSAERALLPGEL
jgi:hypothetical protein